MAGADYRSCDVCGEKTFYDASLNWDDDCGINERCEPLPQYCGDWVSLCLECAKTHRIEIVKKENANDEG